MDLLGQQSDLPGMQHPLVISIENPVVRVPISVLLMPAGK